MRIFIDSNIVIYLIEQPAAWGPRVASRFRVIRDRGDQVVVIEMLE